MSITSKIREQIISTFRAEMAEHIQTITDGLLGVEKQQQTPEERQNTLQAVFRAAHSLKGAARAVGVTAVEQLGHGLENILSDFQKGIIEPKPELYTACYQALDAIQVVESSYEAGETTPPLQALQALTALETVRTALKVTNPPEAAQQLAQPAETQTATPPPAAETNGTPPVVQEGQNAPAGAGEGQGPAGMAPSNWIDETIRVRVDKLDSVIAQLSELLMAKIRLDQRLIQIHHLQNMAGDWQKEWMAARDQYTSLKYNRRSRQIKNGDGASGEAESDADALWYALMPTQTGFKDISNQINELARDYSNDTIHISLVIDALEQEVKQIRLLPLSTITGTFGRMVRNLANAANKEISYEITGSEVEMDKRVLELVKDPLIHMLRNAIDHGIESPNERQRLGKPTAGKILLSAEHLGKDVVIRITDDGRGLDMNAIRRAIARHTGLDSQDMSDSELIGWIFSAGISTSPMVTDVSGRGVGLDVVRRNIEALQGRIDVSSVPDKGTTFILTIPMALTSSHVLLVQVMANTFAIPLSSIERILAVKQEDVTSVGGQQVLRYGGHPLPMVNMKTILGLPDRGQEEKPKEYQRLAVILGAAERRMAFIVDDLVGEQEIVIKGLGKQLARIGGIAGATVLGSGKVVLVVNVADLIKLASRSEGRSAQTVHPVATKTKKKIEQKRILVVDDSITTRTLEKHILEAEGFMVTVATDGQEALSAIATSGLPDLVITDINMPRINGFELTSRIKNDPRTSSVPVILVTSLDSSEDKAHGVQVGADAYIVKSRFDQANLLETIQQLIR